MMLVKFGEISFLHEKEDLLTLRYGTQKKAAFPTVKDLIKAIL